MKSILSVIIAVVIMVDGLYAPGMQEIWGALGALPKTVKASVGGNLGAVYEINSLRALYEFSEQYHTDEEFAAAHESSDLVINMSEELTLEASHAFPIDDTDEEENLTYYPLGTADHPFGGRVKFTQISGSYVSATLDVSMFDHILDSVEIVNVSEATIQLALKRSRDLTDSDAALFAQNVEHDERGGSTSATWNIMAGQYSSTYAHHFSGVLGTVCEGAQVNLTFVNLATATAQSASMISTGNIGLLCGTMEESAGLYVTLSGTNAAYNVSTSSGAAGSLVGEMQTGTVLEVTLTTYEGDAYDLSASRTITGTTYAGGLVGYCDGTVTIQNADSSVACYTASGTITGGTAAGGIFGYYQNSEDETDLSEKYAVSGCTVNASVMGGFFGILKNDADLTIGNGGSTTTVSVTAGQSGSAFGGLIGEYHVTSLSHKLEVLNVTAATSASQNVDRYGGVVAVIGSDTGDDAAYLKADTFTHTSTNGYENESGCFGGVVGDAGTKGSLIDVGTVTIATKSGNSANRFWGGGIVGRLEKGVLRLSGVTDMTNAPANSTDNKQYNSFRRGQLVGIRHEALVYALGSGEAETASYGSDWRFVRSSTDAYADDIGTWGEVVRIANAEGEYGVLNFNGTAHTVTVKAAATAMAGRIDFTKTALNMQLNGGSDVGALCFENKAGSARDNLLANAGLTITGDVDLTGTGITGFMRDDYDDVSETHTVLGNFTGTLTGNGQTITLAVGERYGINSTGVGRGAIMAHRYNGLFARTDAGAQVKGININGIMNVNCIYDNTYVGGVAAVVKDGIVLTDVSIPKDNSSNSLKINFNRLNGSYMYIGGMIGMVASSNTRDITIGKSDGASDITVYTDIKATGNINSNDNGWWRHAVGGVIGLVDSVNAFEISVSDMQLSATVDASEATSVSNMGVSALIADIKWNDNGDYTKDVHTLNLSNIAVKGATVKSNATNNTGGLLGYRWFNTIATFDNVHLEKDGDKQNTLTTKAAYVGGLVNKATGHWTIPSGGIVINSFTADITNKSNNDSRSFGLILNDGYYSNSGLFMEFTAFDSYTIANTNVDVSALSGYTVYDEIMAFSAQKGEYLNSGKHGIVSIATTDNVLSMDGETCNTYQNKYNTSIMNPYGRYYYNLHVIRDRVRTEANPDDGEKLLVWSVYQYCAQNLREYFKGSDGKVPFSGNVISGTFDMKNLSYYPVNAGNITLGRIDVTFYNKEIEETESATGNTDANVRSTRSASQHYLMHFGLFRNISGNVGANNEIHFKGTIGTGPDANGNLHSGALACGSVTSTLNTTSATDIVLEGIKVEGSDSYGKYLLINQVGTNGKLFLSKVRTGGGNDFNNVSKSATEIAYASGETAADSLIGNATGTNIQIEFSKIKLDSRVVAGSVSSDLNGIYGTTKSIFARATLLNAFAVDANSIGVYNYNESEDWSGATHLGHVTYGWEIIKSEEYEDEEQKYYDQAHFTSPVAAGAETAYTDFGDKAKFRSYVAEAYEYGTFREIKVNVRVVGLTSGCGTYNHPYEITKGSQLAVLAKTINGTALPESIRLPKVTVNNDNDRKSMENTKKHKCENEADCAEFTYSGSSGKYEYTGDKKYTWDKTQVRIYLASAYYIVKSDITITSKDNYPGLGAPATDGVNGQFAFRGVIVGADKGDGTTYTITNKSKRVDITGTTNANTMGLISMSNGSVVKNLTVKVELAATDVYNYKANENIAYSYNEQFPNYGAVINKVMGGDNIIDNVKVTYVKYVDDEEQAADFKVLNTGDYKAVVGGYVGAVVNGGLIFRNVGDGYITNFNVIKVDSTGAQQDVTVDEVNLTDLDKGLQDGEDLSHLYVNRFVGRVINGYAILETEDRYAFSESGKYGDGTTRSGAVLTTLKNSTKNYSIPDINKNAATKLTFTQSTVGGVYDTVEAPDGQALYIMSLITQSGSGCAETEAGNYVYAISYNGNNTRIGTQDTYKTTRMAQYSKVGVPTASEGYDSSDYELSTKDMVNLRTAVPYIISHYTSSYEQDATLYYPARTLTQRTFFIKLKDTGGSGITYYLPDSFRGIGYMGSSGNSDTAMNDNMKIYGMDGKGNTIDMNTVYYGYTRTKDTFYQKNMGEYPYLGVALFNYLNQKNTQSNGTEYESERAYKIGYFDLTGYICANTRTDSSDDGKEHTNLHDNGAYNSECLYAAGLVSSAIRGGENDSRAVLYEKYYNFAGITLKDITIKGSGHVGGFISRMRNGKVYINDCDADGLTVEGGGRIGGFIGTAESKNADSGIHINVNEESAESELRNIAIRQIDTTTSSCNYSGGVIGYYSGENITSGVSVDEGENNYGSVLIRNVAVSGGDPEQNFIGSVNPAAPVGYAGGIIGDPEKTKGCLVLGCSVENINIYGRYAGGITAVTGYTNNSTFSRLRTVGCTVKGQVDGSGNPQYTIKATDGAGGIIGFNYDNVSDFDPVYNGETYTVSFDDCLVKNYTIEQTNKLSDVGVGGIIGVERVSSNMANIKVEGCVIKCNGSQNNIGMGGIIGNVNSGKTLAGYNIAVCGNKFDNGALHNTANNIAPYGNLIGRAYGSNIIKLAGFTTKDNTVLKGFGTGSTTDNVRTVEFDTGRYWDHSKTNTPLSNFYDTASTYIIYSDFKAACTAQTDEVDGTVSVSGLTSYAAGESAVDDPGLFPYAVSSPQSAMGTGERFTGDGPAIDSGTSEPLAWTILDADSESDKYYNTSSADRTMIESMTPVNDGSEQDVKLTTYETEMDTLPANVDDFAILALGGAAENGIYTDQITSYIRLLTNSDFDYTADTAGIYRITVKPCRYINGKYQIADGTSGLSRDNSNRYVMKESSADTLQGNNQFSLVDVQFYNPFDSTEIAYHLYVPVLTKRMIKYNFRASALESTEYERTKYPVGNKLAGNFDSWITMYVRYEYSQTDINAILASGRGLDWNNDKTLDLRYRIQQDVADSTQFVLLDNNNNADREFYLTKASVETSLPLGGYATDILDLSAFRAADSSRFIPQSLNDIAGKKVVYTNDAEAENRIYTPTTEEAGDAIAYAYDSDQENLLYFKKAEGTEADELLYALTVTGTVTESYYVSMYTYGDDNVYSQEERTNDAYVFEVAGPATLDGVIPIKRNVERTATVFLGNLFDQTLTITELTEETRMSTTNHVLTATLTSEIRFIQSENTAYFQTMLNAAGITLYQGFMVYLNRYDSEDELDEDQTIKGAPDYSYTVSKNGEAGVGVSSSLEENASGLYIEPVEISIPSYASNSSWSSVQQAQVTFTYPALDTELQNEFPIRNSESSNAGISFYASANLAYSEDQVRYSGQTCKRADNTKRYYMDKREKLDLTLTALDQDIDDGYDHLGEQSKNRSSLGINAKYIDTGLKFGTEGYYEHIDAAANLDASQLPDTILNGDYVLEFELELRQKQDANNQYGYQYQGVNIDTYLKDFQVIGKEGALTPVSTEDGIYRYRIALSGDPSDWAVEYADKQFNAVVSFDVRTGSELERISGYLYSNYKLTMNAKIVKSDNLLEGYEGDPDSIVYTNAKINAQYVTPTD